MCTGAACTGTWAGVAAETLLLCWALQREEFKWTSDLLSEAFWPQHLAGLPVSEGFCRAVMQWVSAGAGLGFGTNSAPLCLCPPQCWALAQEEGHKEMSSSCDTSHRFSWVDATHAWR